VLKISFYYEETKFRLRPTAQWRTWLKAFCIKQGLNHGELSLTMGSNDWLLEKNREHLQHDYYTDILTFDNGGVVLSDSVNYRSADLLISVNFVREYATSHDILFEKELARVMAHGVLHLTGFNDDTDENQAVMRVEEDNAINLWGEFFESQTKVFHVEQSSKFVDSFVGAGDRVVPRGTFLTVDRVIAKKGKRE